MKTFDELQRIIDREIRRIDKTLLPKELYEPIWYTLSNGGKRLRPALVLMGCQLFSDELEQAIKPALGIEMFHNFTLLHDDIMDKAFLRRSHPTVHIKWDINRAILSGDALAIKSNVYISSCKSDILPKVLHVFNQTALQVCEGQQYDLNFELSESVSEADYLNMIKLKTAVLLAGSLQIGALIGGADDATAEQLYHYGYQMGMAFQLQDDYLDTFGDPEIFGKSIGGDILTNKKTFLLIKALELADPGQVESLNKWYSTKKVRPEDKIHAVTKIFKQLEIDRLIREKVEAYSGDALKILDEIEILPGRKTELEIFTRGLIHRVK